MENASTETDVDCSENRQNGEVAENEETFVFEGETLRHSPQLGRRFIKWASEKFN